jgi:hypothetical protein
MSTQISYVSRDIKVYVLQFPAALVQTALCVCPLPCTVDVFKSHLRREALKHSNK